MSFVVEKIVEKKSQVQGCLESIEPGLYTVILHNDDFTPMTFVVDILEMFFDLDNISAKKVMLEAHTKGRAVCGTYNRDIAETRIDQALEYARTHDHPLKWSMEAA